jgi:molybdate transport repressor ModE-like protein
MEDSNGWESLEVRHLRAFAAVARCASFGAAALELGYSQSAASHQLRALEQIVGASLLVRQPGGRRPAELTDAGRLLLVYANEMLARTQSAQSDLDRLKHGQRGRVAVATVQSIGERILPAAIARNHAPRPDVRVEVREMTTTEEIVRAVEEGAVDVGFAPLPVPVDRVDVRPLLTDPYVLVTVAGAPERRLCDVHQKRLFDMRGCQHDRSIEHRLRFENVIPAAIDRFDDHHMIQELVAEGTGVAIVPELTIDPSDPRIAIHHLTELRPRELVTVLRRNREISPYVSDFIDAVAQESAYRRRGSQREHFDPPTGGASTPS